MLGRHTVVVREPAATHTTLEKARAWAARSPKAWDYEVSAPRRCLLPVGAKLCRRHCRRNAGSDRSFSCGREAFTIPYIDPTPQHGEGCRRVWMRSGSSLTVLRWCSLSTTMQYADFREFTFHALG